MENCFHNKLRKFQKIVRFKTSIGILKVIKFKHLSQWKTYPWLIKNMNRCVKWTFHWKKRQREWTDQTKQEIWTINTQVKGCSVSPVFKEVQTKTRSSHFPTHLQRMKGFRSAQLSKQCENWHFYELEGLKIDKTFLEGKLWTYTQIFK